MAPGLTDEVRTRCAAIAAAATRVRIDPEVLAAFTLEDAGPRPALDDGAHFLEGSEDEVAHYLLVLDSVNFGSGWFPTLRKRPGCSGYHTVARGLADRYRAHGPWSGAQLRTLGSDEVAAVLHQRRDHELVALYAQALRALGRWLGERGALQAVAAAGGSAERLAAQLAGGMALFADRGFYKRAQIAGSDLALAGVARFDDLHRLTIFADNLVPHVLRCAGVLRYDDALAAHVDAERLLAPGVAEREIRACAVHACELLSARLGVPASELDHRLWSRGQAPEIKARPRHRTRTVFY